MQRIWGPGLEARDWQSHSDGQSCPGLSGSSLCLREQLSACSRVAQKVPSPTLQAPLSSFLQVQIGDERNLGKASCCRYL